MEPNTLHTIDLSEVQANLLVTISLTATGKYHAVVWTGYRRFSGAISSNKLGALAHALHTFATSPPIDYDERTD